MTFRVKINFSFNFFVFLCNIRHYEKINLIWLTTWNLSLCNWYYLGILLSWLWTHHVLVSVMIVGFAAATMTSWMTAVSTLYVNEQLVSGKTTACTLCNSQLQNYRWNILTMQLFNTSCYVHNRMLAAMQCTTVCLYLLGLRTDQRLQFHVCTTFCLSSWPFWLFWSFWALIISLYSLSQCYKTLLRFVFVSSKACQELDIHWVLGIQNRLTSMYHHIHTFCRLYSVIFNPSTL